MYALAAVLVSPASQATLLGIPGATAFGLWPLFLVFLKLGAVLFGSGYVLLAFLRADLVEHLSWLTEQQLLDAVAVGQVTPGGAAATGMSAAVVARSVALFIVAGLMEIGDGYLVWLWLREGRAVVLGALGGLLLFLYGVVPTLQPAHFGRVYAAYGGAFVVLSVLWGWSVDGHRPDRPELVGAGLCLLGVAVIMYWPRGA